MQRNLILIHGAWLAANSWDEFSGYFSQLGYNVIAPEWPRKHEGVEAQREDSGPIHGLGVEEIVDHYEAIIRELDSPPVIVGHSFGGLFTELLLDRGLGVAGVALDPAPAKGVLRLPFSTLKAAFPVLGNPGNKKKAVQLTESQFHYAFTNTLSEEDAKPIYERYAVPGIGLPLFQGAAANFNPSAETKVDWHNGTRAPLLIVGNSKDHTVPAAVSKEAYSRHKKHSKAITAWKLYEDRPHLTGGVPGWEAVADESLAWAENPVVS